MCADRISVDVASAAMPNIRGGNLRFEVIFTPRNMEEPTALFCHLLEFRPGRSGQFRRRGP